MVAALGWGALAASSLVIGALLGMMLHLAEHRPGLRAGLRCGRPDRQRRVRAGAEGHPGRRTGPVALGLAFGAATYFLANRRVKRLEATPGAAAGLPLALGALLDGIPEQAVLGISLERGGGISVVLLAAVFVSNLPEAVGSASAMAAAGWTRRKIMGLWSIVAGICMLSTVGGHALARVTGGPMEALIDGFAAGALLVMMTDAMIPEARHKAEDWAGLATVLGFAVAAGLSTLSA